MSSQTQEFVNLMFCEGPTRKTTHWSMVKRLLVAFRLLLSAILAYIVVLLPAASIFYHERYDKMGLIKPFVPITIVLLLTTLCFFWVLKQFLETAGTRRWRKAKISRLQIKAMQLNEEYQQLIQKGQTVSQEVSEMKMEDYEKRSSDLKRNWAQIYGELMWHDMREGKIISTYPPPRLRITRGNFFNSLAASVTLTLTDFDQAYINDDYQRRAKLWPDYFLATYYPQTQEQFVQNEGVQCLIKTAHVLMFDGNNVLAAIQHPNPRYGRFRYLFEKDEIPAHILQDLKRGCSLTVEFDQDVEGGIKAIRVKGFHPATMEPDETPKLIGGAFEDMDRRRENEGKLNARYAAVMDEARRIREQQTPS